MINGTVQKIREKLIRWRKFSKTTLVNADANMVQSLRDDFHRMQEETKKELREQMAGKAADDGSNSG